MTVKKTQKKKKISRTKKIPKTTASPNLFPQSLREKWKSQYDLTIGFWEEKLEEFISSPSTPNPISLMLKYSDILSKMKVKRHFQNFLEDGDFANVLRAIPQKGYDHPLLREIIHYLHGIILKEKLKGINRSRKKAEGYFRQIANGVAKSITSFTEVKVPKRGSLLFRSLESFPTYEDKLKYVAGIHKEHQKQLSRRRYKKGILLNTAIDRLKEKQALLEDASPQGRIRIKKEIRTLGSRITDLKEEENEIHKEAKRRTLNDLEKKTGYRVSYRILEDWLAQANRLNLD